MPKRIRSALFAAALAACVTPGPRSWAQPPGSARPSPGSGAPAKSREVEEVRLGYFGPSDPADPAGGDMWLAAKLAIEEANAAGGLGGKPFRLVPAWSADPWGTGVAKLVRMVYRQRVWAIVGGVDGPSTHLAEQVAAKARLTLINPVSTDRTVNLAYVPWVFSLAPGDHLTAGPLAREISRRAGKGGLVILSADDHDSRVLTAQLRKALAKWPVRLRRQFEFRRGEKRFGPLAKQVQAVGPGAVAVAAGAADGVRLVGALRVGGYRGAVFAGPAMGRRAVAESPGGVEGVVFPVLYDPSNLSEAGKAFGRTFRRRHGTAPDYTAAHTYDAVRLLIAAIRKAGLDRTRIRDAVRDLSPWPGVTGTVRWDRVGSNTRVAPLGTIKKGLVRSARPPRAPGESTAR
jgi:ABC-type branched-subunit amino acid transport system substrate-binding protein